MRAPKLTTVLTWLPYVAVAVLVAWGWTWLRSAQRSRDEAARQRDEARLEAADAAVAAQRTRREMLEAAYGQATLKSRAKAIRKAVPGARPTMVLSGSTGPLVPHLELKLTDRPTIDTQVQLWETPAGAVGVVGHTAVKLGGQVVVEGDWDRRLTRAEVERLAPPQPRWMVEAGQDLLHLSDLGEVTVGARRRVAWQLWLGVETRVGDPLRELRGTAAVTF